VRSVLSKPLPYPPLHPREKLFGDVLCFGVDVGQVGCRRNLRIRLSTHIPCCLDPHAQTLASSFWPSTFPHLREHRGNLNDRHAPAIRGHATGIATSRTPYPGARPGLEGRAIRITGGLPSALSRRWTLRSHATARTNRSRRHSYNFRAFAGTTGRSLIDLIDRDSLSQCFSSGYSMAESRAEMAVNSRAPRRAVAGRFAAVCPRWNWRCASTAVGRVEFRISKTFVSDRKDRIRRNGESFSPESSISYRWPRAHAARIENDVITATYFGFRCRVRLFALSRRTKSLRDLRAHARGDGAGLSIRPFSSSFSDPAFGEDYSSPSDGIPRKADTARLSRSAADDRLWAEPRDGFLA